MRTICADVFCGQIPESGQFSTVKMNCDLPVVGQLWKNYGGILPILALSAGLRADPPPAWQEEFNQATNSGPLAATWSYDLGGGGWGNAELETYTNSRSNSYVTDDTDATDGKALVIRAVKDSSGNYTSARIISSGLFATQYGRVEARMKLPKGQGLWPAFWMLGQNIGTVGWPACGEIDIMEVLGQQPGKLYGTLHGPGYSGGNGKGSSYVLPNGASFSDAYHVFAVEWQPGQIDWLVDGTKYFTVKKTDIPAGTSWVPDVGPFFIILNLAVGGNWPGSPDGTTVFPAELRIDYVRYYPRLPRSSLWPMTPPQ
jgi:beta-glucanase (GH16 family)